jgi:hypothetical protein
LRPFTGLPCAAEAPVWAEACAVKRLVKNIGWLLGGRGLNAVLSLVYLAIATRTLGWRVSGISR